MWTLKRWGGLAASAAFALAACSPKAAPPAMSQPEVSVAPVAPGLAMSVEELPGRVSPLRLAEVRARIAGVVLRRTFREGGEIRQGEVLYLIDPAPLRAAVQGARAALQKAEASQRQASRRGERMTALRGSGAVSAQDEEAARAAADEALADVNQARAALAKAELDLGYATVRAPISGKVGRSMVTEGALVGQNEATLMAVLQQIDTVYVDVKQSAAQLDALRQAQAASARVKLILESGAYPLEGRLLFSDISVDPGTGEVTLRAQFPNPDRRLLPGMFVRVRLERPIEQALTVPQQAVQRDAGGAAQVIVVDAKGRTSVRTIRTAGVDRGRFIVASGLRAGERVVVEGHQNVQPGATVKTVPWSPAPAAAS